MALAELQATEALRYPGQSSQSAKSYLSEMKQNYTNAGNMCLFKWRIQYYSGVNLSDIEEMLHNINSYGLSHLCAFSVFELAEKYGNSTFNYPFLDIYFKNDRANRKHDVEFYSRGNKNYKTSFNNLFEYHIFHEQSGYKDWNNSLAE